MKCLSILLFLILMTILVSSTSSLPTYNSLESSVIDEINSQSSDSHPRIRRSPKGGGIILKVENDNGKTSIIAEGRQTIYEGKYGTINVNGELVKTPSEETKGRIGLEARVEW